MKYAMIALILLAVLAPVARADAPRLAPSESYSVTEDGVTTIALRFDVSGIDEGVLKLASAYLLEWPVGQLGREERVTVDMYRAPAGWSGQGFSATPEFSDETYLDTWTIDPVHAEKNGQGFIRLDLSEVGVEWGSETTPNPSVLIRVPQAKGGALRSLIASVRLVIY